MSEDDPKYAHKKTFEKEINKQILRARKIKWFKQEELMQREKEVILHELSSLLRLDETPTTPVVQPKPKLSRETSPLIDLIDVDQSLNEQGAA